MAICPEQETPTARQSSKSRLSLGSTSVTSHFADCNKFLRRKISTRTEQKWFINQKKKFIDYIEHVTGTMNIILIFLDVSLD